MIRCREQKRNDCQRAAGFVEPVGRLLADARENVLAAGRELNASGVIATLATMRFASVLLLRVSQACGAVSPLAAGLMKQFNHLLTGADIAWQAEIGPGFVLFHPTGVVIGPRCTLGENCRVQQGVTLGQRSGGRAPDAEEDSPTIGSRVEIGAGCRVLGAISVGDRARLGANAVVLQNIPPGATAVGVPAVVVRAGVAQDGSLPAVGTEQLR